MRPSIAGVMQRTLGPNLPQQAFAPIVVCELLLISHPTESRKLSWP